MSAGMCWRQKDIGWPTTRVSIPLSRANAAAEQAYGPAPMTSRSVRTDMASPEDAAGLDVTADPPAAPTRSAGAGR